MEKTLHASPAGSDPAGTAAAAAPRNLFRAASRACRRFARALAERHRTAREIAELRGMSDRALHDIGITRADITAAARGTFPSEDHRRRC